MKKKTADITPEWTERQIFRVWAKREQEAEVARARLASDLHDKVATMISAAKVKLCLAGRDQGSSAGKEIQDQVHAILDGVIEETRRFIAELRPPLLDDLGLSDAIRWLVKSISRDIGLTINLTLSPDPLSASGMRATGIFRTAQDLLQGVALETQAGNVDLHLSERGGIFRIEYRDNGQAWTSEVPEDPDIPALLRIRMRTLAAAGRIASGPGSSGGNRITLELPTSE
jgi:signal transduction histidine kinase